MEKPNLSTIIHDLKVSFRKKFGPGQELTQEIELAINLAAKKVKQGFLAEWYENNGVKIKFTQPRRWRAMPLPKPVYDGKSNPTGHKHK